MALHFTSALSAPTRSLSFRSRHSSCLVCSSAAAAQLHLSRALFTIGARCAASSCTCSVRLSGRLPCGEPDGSRACHRVPSSRRRCSGQLQHSRGRRCLSHCCQARHRPFYSVRSPHDKRYPRCRSLTATANSNNEEFEKLVVVVMGGLLKMAGAVAFDLWSAAEESLHLTIKTLLPTFGDRIMIELFKGIKVSDWAGMR